MRDCQNTIAYVMIYYTTYKSKDAQKQRLNALNYEFGASIWSHYDQLKMRVIQLQNDSSETLYVLAGVNTTTGNNCTQFKVQFEKCLSCGRRYKRFPLF